MAKPRIKLPDSAKVGDLIEIKTLISHVMETGQRKDADGKTIPRSIINSFKVKFAGKDVFSAELQPQEFLRQSLSSVLHEGTGSRGIRVHVGRGRRGDHGRKGEAQRHLSVGSLLATTRPWLALPAGRPGCPLQARLKSLGNPLAVHWATLCPLPHPPCLSTP